MICPKCGNEQPNVFSQCQKCRYIFPQQPPSVRSGAARHSAGAWSQHGMVVLGGLTGVLLLGIFLWWLNTSEGLPPEEGSYMNEQHQFAMAAPADWTVLTKDNYQEMFEKLGDRFPPMLRSGLRDRNVEVGFMRLLENEEFSPSVNVVVMNVAVPSLDEEELAEGEKALSEGFKSMLDQYSMKQSELVQVDNLTSARFTSSGTLRAKVPIQGPQVEERTATGQIKRSGQRITGDEWKTFELKFVQTLVPGKGRAYIVTSSALVSQYPAHQKTFDRMMESFRVLQRPSRFGPIVMGALNGGAAAALGYLLLMVILNVIGLFRKKVPPIEAAPA